ncbi:signal recognition particle GTPase Ffh [Cupriavidus necator N-1]|jgi:signal recognition particle subunit SRP54|uniref:Signal recognition particle protein n=1 Tax=Cupriavidus necator (strain ATCC 43291 / DSM 13513 / CCUG 52238 / LMG 8453 / N-1) TaxID=1042878 RepID=G0EWM9_CUPNN|nr:MULTISPECIES: signal recognition particle protein [Cupriavidus]AEI78486.1 signal recognition particle GTPase Ffh [Cupriavidus necator N-1]KAI3598971.1 Signal recognition particle protein Ffh [Cupriavidus necator H850]MDX6012990.1 signal recognition particle protein [Cupriavidus necator]QUN27946.1 signal recognition particle protein [Cupriavidus sp. KK10]UIF85712.1 signal recognition particle protein [Cupriavidus necator]
MLDNLTQRLARVVKTMRGEARLTEANTAEMLREVRLAMLEADVALPVVREFVARVKEKAMGEEVVSSLTPGQALVGVVQRELTAVIGGADAASGNNKEAELNLAVQPPAIILMAGLQGAGKTTTVGKLAKWLKENKKKKVLTVSCDVYRPAAIAQLKTVSEQVGADFFPSQPDQKPVDIARAAVDWARKHYHDVLIVDTAGRLGIDELMMQEIAALHAELKPAETLFVVDAMLGQDAVNTAKAFNDTLPLTGVVLTKLDGDARGGAALSVRHITGRPIKFVGVGEKLDGLEPFYPDRMAQRILGMGDILALVEEAQRGVDMEAAEKLAKKIKKTGDFDLEDFKAQIGQMKKMGGLGSLVDKLPAQFAQQAQGANMDQAEKQVARMEGIINSMTPTERAKPELIKASRKRRIAAGAGVPVQEVNRLLNQFDQMQSMMKKLKGGGMMKMMRQMGAMKGGMKGLFNR